MLYGLKKGIYIQALHLDTSYYLCYTWRLCSFCIHILWVEQMVRTFYCDAFMKMSTSSTQLSFITGHSFVHSGDFAVQRCSMLEMSWKRICTECKVTVVSFSYYCLLKSKRKLEECLWEAVTEGELAEFTNLLQFLSFLHFVGDAITFQDK